MATKFNLYDLFGLFIPGALFLQLIHEIGHLLGIPRVIEITSASGLFIFIAASYVTGHVLHHATRKLITCPRFSETMLNDDDRLLPGPIKAALRTAIATQFQLPIPQANGNGKVSADRALNQGAFDLCYTSVIQRGKGAYTENFNALYGMCRSLVVVSGTFSLYFVVASVKKLSPTWSPLAVFVGLVIGAVLVPLFLHARKVYARLFAVSVYRSFYGLHADRNATKGE